MKIDLPQEFNNGVWMVIKDNQPQYQFIVSYDYRLIKEMFDLSLNKQDFFVLPPINLSSNEWNKLYIPQGQTKISQDCFTTRDELTVVVTGKSTLCLDSSSFGNSKSVSLVLPKGMSLFEIIYKESYCHSDGWLLIANENFDPKKVEDLYIQNRFFSRRADYVGTSDTVIMVDKSRVYENGEIIETGLTNKERDEQIESARKHIKTLKRYPNMDYSI